MALAVECQRQCVIDRFDRVLLLHDIAAEPNFIVTNNREQAIIASSRAWASINFSQPVVVGEKSDEFQAFEKPSRTCPTVSRSS